MLGSEGDEMAHTAPQTTPASTCPRVGISVLLAASPLPMMGMMGYMTNEPATSKHNGGPHHHPSPMSNLLVGWWIVGGNGRVTTTGSSSGEEDDE